MYKWKALIFTYKSTSSDVISSTSGALGTVTLATDYNALDGGYTNLREMNNAEHSNSQRPSSSFIHAVDCKKMQQKSYYVRSGPPNQNGDLRLYDGAITTLATSGMAVPGGGIGQLWVTYTIEFMKPIFTSNRETNTQIFVQEQPNTVVTFFAPNAAIMGNPATIKSYGNVGANISYDGFNVTFSFPEEAAGKTFQLDYYFKANSGAAIPASELGLWSADLGVGGKILNIKNILDGTSQYGVGLGSPDRKTFRMYFTLGAFDSTLPFEVKIASSFLALAYWPATLYETVYSSITGLDTSCLPAFQ